MFYFINDYFVASCVWAMRITSKLRYKLIQPKEDNKLVSSSLLNQVGIKQLLIDQTTMLSIFFNISVSKFSLNLFLKGCSY